MALTEWSVFSAAHRDKLLQSPPVLLTVKGIGADSNVYLLEGDSATGGLVISGGNITGTFTPSGLTKGGLVSVVTVNAVSWTVLPLTPLANRNQINIQNDNSSTSVKLNYDRTDIGKPLPAGFEGMTLAPGIEKGYAIKDTILIYAKSEMGTVNLNIEEIA